MTRRLTPLSLAALCGLTLALALLWRAAPQAQTAPFAVHEWGTFTSVAQTDGRAAEWMALAGPQDLPCFVDQTRVPKIRISGTVRMETPVLYFYAPAPMTVNVGVAFRQGVLTDWYPRALVAPSEPTNVQLPSTRGTIAWTDVRVQPGVAERFPVEDGASHYYAARETDSAPLEVAGQREKFLFYRGVGGFQPPIAASLSASGVVTVHSLGPQPLGDVILFQHRKDGMAYSVGHFDGSEGVFQPLAGLGEFVPPTAELEQILRAHGLYEKEARAMVSTWRDSWFEEGTRLFYVAPRAFIDDTLPLTMSPAPTTVERVFVGRVEISTPEDRQRVSDALRAHNTAALVRFGRFLQPVADQLMAEAPTAADQQAIKDAMVPVYAAAFAATSTCPAR